MKKKFEIYADLIAGYHKLGLRRRVLILALSGALFAFFTLGALAFYGMSGVERIALFIGGEIGQQASEGSSEMLLAEKRGELSRLASGIAGDISRELFRIRQLVVTLESEMNAVTAHPENFSPRPYREPRTREEQEGKFSSWLFYAPGVTDKAALVDEIALTANICDFLTGIAEIADNGNTVTTYAASKNGFIFESDNTAPGWWSEPDWQSEPAPRSVPDSRSGSDSQSEPDSRSPESGTFNYFARPWYQAAKRAGKLVFTDVYYGARSGRLAISCIAPYKDTAGNFGGVVGIGIALNELNHIIHEAKFSGTGFAFVVDNHGHVILSSDPDRENAESNELAVVKKNPPDLRKSQNRALADTVGRMIGGGDGVAIVPVNGEDYYIAFAPVDEMNWSVAAALRKDEVTSLVDENQRMIQTLTEENVRLLSMHMRRTMIFMAALALPLLLLITYLARRLSLHFAAPIQELSDGVREIAAGNLDKRLDIKTGDEIEKLADAFNAMTGDLKKYIENLTRVTAERERIATELSVATNIQAGMLPNIFPPWPEREEFDIFASMNPAKEVGGDFYDFYLVDKTHLAVTIADVSGKGVGAALFMVIAKTILKNSVMMTKDNLAVAMERANDQLCQGNDESMFVTVFLGVLDTKSGEFTFVNGGHNPPLMRTDRSAASGRRTHADSTTPESSTTTVDGAITSNDTSDMSARFKYLSLKKSCMLGAMECVTYQSQSFMMNPGDMLFLYTDGVTEAQDVAGTMYSEARLLDTLNREPQDRDAKGILAAVRKSVADYVGEAEQFDDITMLGLVYKGRRGRYE